MGGYPLLTRLGQGGAADVYLAVAGSSVMTGFQKLLVVKHLRADQDGADTMFFDETRLAARLSHPNVVQTNEVGTDGDDYFMVMEYVDGQPLDSLFVRGLQGALDRARALPLLLYVLCETLAGLHYAHELRDYDGSPLQIVHRDVSPHNVMITYEGQVKVVDFGIAKAARRVEHTTEGIVKGKIRYMAPEQALGLPVDRRADLFSAGVILYEILSGQEMWGDLGDVQVFSRLLDGAYPQSVSDAPPELARILAKALHRDASQRYRTAAEFRRELIDYLRANGEDDLREELAEVMKRAFMRERAAMEAIVRQKLATPEPFSMPAELRATRPDRTSPTLAPRRVLNEAKRGALNPAVTTAPMLDPVDRDDNAPTRVMNHSEHTSPMLSLTPEPPILGRVDTTATFVALERLSVARRRRFGMMVVAALMVFGVVLTVIALSARSW